MAPERSREKKKKTAAKPEFRVVRNNLGAFMILSLACFFDLVIFIIDGCLIHTYAFPTMKYLDPPMWNRTVITLISFIASAFSLLFTLAILMVSSLTMLKRKRIKVFPFLFFAIFKLFVYFWEEHYALFCVLLFKDVFLYVCMSHTSKNWLVRRLFKPYKQVVYYNTN